jgi:chromosome segregation ATPase
MDNEERIRQIKLDAVYEIEDIDQKHDNNKVHVSEMSLKSKAELQLTINKLAEIQQELGSLNRSIDDKKPLISKQDVKNQELSKEATALEEKIAKKDRDIGIREKKIYQLKKKTQELEKFKFVLDFKIKDLNRAIQPKEEQI